MKRKNWIAPFFFLSMGIAAFHCRQILSGFDYVPGDHVDNRFIAYLLEHWFQAIRGNTELLSPAMLFPQKRTLAYSHFLVGHVPFYSLFRVTGLNQLSSLQGTLICLDLLNFGACFFLLRAGLGVRSWLAAGAAALFTFNSAKLNQIAHLQLYSLFLFPLELGLILKWWRCDPRARPARKAGYLWATAFALSVQFLTEIYNVWFFLFWLGLFFLALLLRRNSRAEVWARVRQDWPSLLSAAGFFAFVMIPFALLYLPVLGEFGPWPYEIVRIRMPGPASLLWMGAGNQVWGEILERVPLLREMVRPSENPYGLGLGMALAVTWLLSSLWSIGGLGRVNSRRDFLLADLILSVNFFLVLVVSFGDFSLWQWIYDYVPGASAIRSTNRFMVSLALPVCVALALLLERAISRGERRNAKFAALLVALILLEQLGTTQGFSKSKESLRISLLSQGLPRTCDGFYVARGDGASYRDAEIQIDAILVSQATGIPTLNGYSAHYPRDWNLFTTADPEYERRVTSWINRKGLTGKICRLSVP